MASGGTLKQTARFTNNLKATVKVTNIKASCGCTVAAGADQSVAPGATGEITIQINTAGQPVGQQAKSITVLTEEQGRTCSTVLSIPYSITAPTTATAATASALPPASPLSLPGATTLTPHINLKITNNTTMPPSAER